jgi:hypothetical protein
MQSVHSPRSPFADKTILSDFEAERDQHYYHEGDQAADNRSNPDLHLFPALQRRPRMAEKSSDSYRTSHKPGQRGAVIDN